MLGCVLPDASLGSCFVRFWGNLCDAELWTWCALGSLKHVI